MGIASATVDGNDVIAVADLAATFVERLRRGEGPMFIHALTYRLRGHTIADKGTYRDAAEHARREALDPILLLRRRLTDAGLASEAQSLAAEVEAEIAEALSVARASPFPEPEQALTDVQDAGAPA